MRNTEMPSAHFLLPFPKDFQPRTGVCLLGPNSALEVRVADPRVEQALQHWRATLSGGQAVRRPAAVLAVVESPGQGSVPHRDGYRIEASPDALTLVGTSPAGCFHGLQTLRQMTQGRRGALPCCTVRDWPDFETRGLLHDVTRGKVPTLETLKLIADRLAMLKANQLQLYIEHAFTFSFDPAICGPDQGLTPDDVRELDRYCRDRFIDLVPALATLGHMGRILSMPRYRHLAEIEATKAWEAMTWPDRMRGLTLDCMSPEAHELVERMWSDVLDVFSSPVVNICGDEPWDLGKGKNSGRLHADRRGAAYIDHILRTNDLCAARDRRTQVFSDVVRNHPEQLHRLPRDLTVLHWGYDDQADLDGTSTFVETGCSTFVCPGTSGWKRIINAMDLAERNIAAFARAGHRHGAKGLVNTDWGDHGHFNLLACSWHGIALGAAVGWTAEHAIGDRFDEAFARVVLGFDDAEGVRLLRKASALGERCETWRLLWMPRAAIADDSTLPAREVAAQSRSYAREFLRWCESADRQRVVDVRDLDELAVAARFTEWFADKVVLLHDARTDGQRFGAGADQRYSWSDSIGRMADSYAECWRARNKRSGLEDILLVLRKRGAECDELCR